MTKKTELTAADLRVGQRVWVETEDRNFDSEIRSIERLAGGGLEYEISVYDPCDIARPFYVELSEIKPILRRLDSMTKEETEEYQSLCWEETYEYASSDFHDTIQSVLYLLDNDFDVRGWIDAGLAIDAATLEGDANV